MYSANTRLEEICASEVPAYNMPAYNMLACEMHACRMQAYDTPCLLELLTYERYILRRDVYLRATRRHVHFRGIYLMGRRISSVYLMGMSRSQSGILKARIITLVMPILYIASR
jgi:hypothetical protein